MDEAHLPIGDTAAFDKRVADHKAILDEYLAADLAALAGRYDITPEQLAHIEDEAHRLRWLPPPDPKPEDLEPEESKPDAKTNPEPAAVEGPSPQPGNPGGC